MVRGNSDYRRVLEKKKDLGTWLRDTERQPNLPGISNLENFVAGSYL